MVESIRAEAEQILGRRFYHYRVLEILAATDYDVVVARVHARQEARELLREDRALDAADNRKRRASTTPRTTPL